MPGQGCASVTIDANGWIDWADHFPGPGNKVYELPNLGLGLVLHSVEGWYAGAIGELMKPERKASWQFTLKLDGTLVQHYPVTASCWASGNLTANVSFWSMELEGVQPTPINDAQMMTAEALFAEWEEWSGKKATRDEPNKTLWLHREVATRWEPNGGPTACPSERYALLWAALEDDMTPEQLARLDAIERRLDRMEADDTTVIEDAWLGPRLTQIEQTAAAYINVLTEHMAAGNAVHQAGKIPDHKHTPGGVA